MKRNLIVSAALAGLLGAGAFAATTSPAAAYTTRRCDAYGCWMVRCDNDGDTCHRVWDRDRYDRRDYYSHSGYYRHHDWDDQWHNRRWRCDPDGDDCHWVYESF